MLIQWIESIQTHGPQIWVGLCVLVLTFGMILCAGNLRRQILIGVVLFFWGITQTYYSSFYSAPFARYWWFPYWVFLDGIIIISIVFVDDIKFWLAKRFQLGFTRVTKDELNQELVITVLSFIMVFAHIAQLGSALAGLGRATAEAYDMINRLGFGVMVIALILPGKLGLTALKDAVSEKIADMVGRRPDRNADFDSA